MKANFLLQKVPKRLGRVLYERFPEPLHLNILSIFVALFGSYKTKLLSIWWCGHSMPSAFSRPQSSPRRGPRGRLSHHQSVSVKPRV